MDFEEEVVLCLIGEHVGVGPAISVGAPLFVFPFDATESNAGGCFADLLYRYVLAVAGVRNDPEGQGCVSNHSCMLVWYWSLEDWSLNMLGTLRDFL